jgi:hypothetical protein
MRGNRLCFGRGNDCKSKWTKIQSKRDRNFSVVSVASVPSIQLPPVASIHFASPIKLCTAEVIADTHELGPQTMLQILSAVVFLALIVVLPVVMVRGLIQMYRDKERSGTFSSAIAGCMGELDRVIRPSAEYVIETKESGELHEDDIGGN